MNLLVYLRDKEMFFYSGEKKASGIFESEQQISDFLKENNVSSVNIVFSRPTIFLRTLEFPFSSLKKVSDVLLEESAPLFPVSVDELEFFWYPVKREKEKTSVCVIAFEKSKIEKWHSLSSTYKFRINICFEPFVLFSYVSRTITDSEYLCVFVDGRYLSGFTVKNKLIVESFSSYLDNKQDETILSDFISNKNNLPVVCVGDFSTTGIQGCRILRLQRKEHMTLLFSLFEVSQPSFTGVPFKLYRIKTSEISFNPAFVFGFVLFLAFAGMMFRPIFIVNQIQKNIDNLNTQIEQTFKAAFPDVKKLVNPLVQAKEQIRNLGEVQKVVPKLSAISIMQKISEVVPENIPFSVSQMSLRGTDLFLNCSTNNLENVESLTQIFKKQKEFQNIKVGSIAPESNQITFNLLIKVVEYDKDKAR